jgi:AmmeMemoRadiSam system protein A
MEKKPSSTRWSRPVWLKADTKQQLLTLARNTLNSLFGGDPDRVLESFRENEIFQNPELGTVLPCFITLVKAETLRGCIGCLQTERSLAENVNEYSQLAALSDSRFPPLRPDEVPACKIEITVLGPQIPLKTFGTLEIGKHGLCVNYRKNRGVLLAHVATQYRWTHEQFLTRTCEKAGLDPTQKQNYEWHYFKETVFKEP